MHWFASLNTAPHIAIIFFILDVGVRRIQIDREEWERLLRRVLFWRAVSKPAGADDSLTALLARRDQVRSTKTAGADARPELFRPVKPVEEAQPIIPSGGSGPTATAAPDAAQSPEPSEAPAASTTSRLLEAKRRAQKRKGGPGAT